MKTAENAEEDPDNPEGDNQMQYFSDESYRPSIGAVINCCL
jgi:hypothetical protein